MRCPGRDGRSQAADGIPEPELIAAFRLSHVKQVGMIGARAEATMKGGRGAARFLPALEVVHGSGHLLWLTGVRKMEVSVTDAEAQLTELVRKAEAGEDIVLTRQGHPIVRLVPVRRKLNAAERRALIEEIMASGAANALPGPDAARSQDFLYDENGLPR
jgi:prevent-host-death family protein